MIVTPARPRPGTPPGWHTPVGVREGSVDTTGGGPDGGRRTPGRRWAGGPTVAGRAQQRHLLDATNDGLAALGHADTTTSEVAQRAGVSLGAPDHHFPTEADLAAAAIEHLFAEQTRRFGEGFLALPEESRTLEQASAQLWGITRGLSFVAVLEVTVAARTSPSPYSRASRPP
jgi:AcrR family transcriptional regulator